MVVKFKDQQVKDKMVKMSFGKKLTITSNQEIVHNSVTHDKTKKQREEYQNHNWKKW